VTVVAERAPTSLDAAGGSYLKYCNLNPAESFRAIVDRARAVVFVGGTMQPVSHLVEQLLPDVPPSRLDVLSCTHVVPPENVLALCVGAGATGRRLLFSYKERGVEAQLDDLGDALCRIVAKVPGGVVCFFPSVAMERSCWERWSHTGVAAGLAMTSVVRGAACGGSLWHRGGVRETCLVCAGVS
jgi:chromosome transmission fidelity protein 1